MKRTQDSFLHILRLGIGHKSYPSPVQIDWNAIESYAIKQGLLAVLVDAVECLPASKRPSQEVLLQWIGETLQAYEHRYELYGRAIAELAGFYNRHGFKMMVLKGYACSLDWPKPEHRPCGDIDIWLFGKQKEGDAILTKEKGINVDASRHHHTIFDWKDFTVENHYDFINVHHHKSNSDLEKIFKELGADDSHYVESDGEKVYLPSPNLHALFLLRHSMTDFAASELTLRQVLDWAFFVEKHNKDVDWKWLLSVLEQFHMREFFNCINAICVDNLGFSVKIFPNVQFDPQLKDRVLTEIISPRFPREEPTGFITKNIYRYKRWRANEWKHKLCYEESMWSAFWTEVYSHLLKPASI